MSKQANDLNRLRWKCRRGMLELDLFFEHFLQNGYAHLTLQQCQTFETMLDESDPDLFAWFMGHREPSAEYLELVVLIRASRPS